MVEMMLGRFLLSVKVGSGPSLNSKGFNSVLNYFGEGDGMRKGVFLAFRRERA